MHNSGTTLSSSIYLQNPTPLPNPQRSRLQPHNPSPELVVDANLETSGAPVHKLDGGNNSINIFGHHITTRGNKPCTFKGVVLHLHYIRKKPALKCSPKVLYKFTLGQTSQNQELLSQLNLMDELVRCH